MTQSLKVRLEINSILLDSIESTRGLDSKTVNFLMHPGWFFADARSAGKWYDFFCGVSAFVVAFAICLVSALMRTVSKAGV